MLVTISYYYYPYFDKPAILIASIIALKHIIASIIHINYANGIVLNLSVEDCLSYSLILISPANGSFYIIFSYCNAIITVFSSPIEINPSIGLVYTSPISVPPLICSTSNYPLLVTSYFGSRYCNPWMSSS